MKKVLALVLIVVMLTGLMAACGGNPAIPGTSSTPAATSAPSGTTTAPAVTGDPDEIGFPIDTTETLTYWIRLNTASVTPNYTTLNDIDFAKFLEEDTGVFVEYVSPPVGQETEAFSLLISSGDMPDIVEYSWNTFPGGPAAAVMNGTLIPHNDLFARFAPALTGLLEENPDYDKMVKTDDGVYYTYPVMKLDDTLNTTAGPVVRWDWLDDLNMAHPETIEDWYNMLVAFRDEKGAEYPLSFPGWGWFRTHMGYTIIGAYGVNMSWYLENGAVVFGPYEPGYKDWLLEMAKWYAEGLIDPNFATNDGVAVDSNIINHDTGATSLWLGSGLGRYLPPLREENERYTMGPVQYPVLNRGETPKFSSLLNMFDGTGASITTSASNPELAARWLDYGYTEPGRKLYNYGREGISWYFDAQGIVQLTDAIWEHEKGWPLNQAWSQFARGVYPGPYFSEARFLELYYPYDEQVKGLELFTATNMREHLLPPISPSPDEANQFGRVMSDVLAHVDEYTMTAILGIVDVEATFESYLDELRGMGIEEAIAIQNTALERYANR